VGGDEDGYSDAKTSYANEREERRGLEQRAATLIASMLVTLGLATSGGTTIADEGGVARALLVAAVATLAIAVAFLAVALARGSEAQPSAGTVAQANVKILGRIRAGTLLLALGVLLAAAALVVAFVS
jgi:hypothetical protein